MFMRQLFDPSLAHYSYLIGCQKTGESVVIDPQRDIDRYRQLAEENDLRITAVADTHIHADYLTGAREFAADPSVALYLSAEELDVLDTQFPAFASVDALRANDDFGSLVVVGQFGIVKKVNWVTQLQHDQIGCVDDIVDRAVERYAMMMGLERKRNVFRQ